MTTTSSRKFFFSVEPVPASRPRVSRWGTYYGKRYEKFRRDMREVLRTIELEPLDGELVATLEFLVSPPKTTKRSHPRGDIDNYIKGPLDSMTHHGGFWRDDDQIVKITATKRFTHEGETNGIKFSYRRTGNTDSSTM
jgi:Holliday junction resolvase RusA-like endonuclease